MCFAATVISAASSPTSAPAPSSAESATAKPLASHVAAAGSASSTPPCVGTSVRRPQPVWLRVCKWGRELYSQPAVRLPRRHGRRPPVLSRCRQSFGLPVLHRQLWWTQFPWLGRVRACTVAHRDGQREPRGRRVLSGDDRLRRCRLCPRHGFMGQILRPVSHATAILNRQLHL